MHLAELDVIVQHETFSRNQQAESLCYDVRVVETGFYGTTHACMIHVQG